LFAIILLILFALAGVVFGALNADMVTYDLAFASVTLPKGAALLAALLIGWILGGVLVWLLSAHPLKRRLARTQRAAAATAGATPAIGSETPPA
jgi:uncharacterized integral membrane protein